MQKYGGWEPIEPPLGSGGQSTVYLARSPERVTERQNSFAMLKALSALGLNDPKDAESFARASWDLARPDKSTELGALKIFKAREGGAPALERLKREISVLREGRPGLPKLHAANETEQWMVTEFFPNGSLDKVPNKYKGQAISALRAFRGLVQIIATDLHKDGIVHRDLKPANVFIGSDGNLVPGDFGIVYFPVDEKRPTLSDERVGPRDFMAPWADLGARLEEVRPNSDVYMLGKLLWCMISGHARLPREYFRKPTHNLENLFPGDRLMSRVNLILDKCIVETPETCLRSAHELLALVSRTLDEIGRSVPTQDQDGQLILPCRICGSGIYKEWAAPQIRLTSVNDAQNRQMPPIHLRVFVCNVCAHYAFFAPGYPDEAAGRGWASPSPPSS